MVSQELVQEMQDIREEMDDTVVIGDEDVLSTSSGSSVEVVEAPAGSERPVLTPQIVALWATMMAVVLTVSVWYMQRYGYISTLTPIGGESVYVFKSAGGDSIKVVAPGVCRASICWILTKAPCDVCLGTTLWCGPSTMWQSACGPGLRAE